MFKLNVYPELTKSVIIFCNENEIFHNLNQAKYSPQFEFKTKEDFNKVSMYYEMIMHGCSYGW